jgi:hypothetical protein
VRKKPDGFVALAAEAGVDAGRGLFHRLVELPIVFDEAAAGRCQLHEGEATDVGGKAFEQAFDGEEALFDALGVVEAIDTHAEDGVFVQAQLGEDAAPAFLDGGRAL